MDLQYNQPKRMLDYQLIIEKILFVIALFTVEPTVRRNIRWVEYISGIHYQDRQSSSQHSFTRKYRIEFRTVY